ncbi:GT2 family glycosyltransferase [Methanobacterium petrolearium]|nr:GT2 family glycosyltransferase [Methanobacterium petrolearium]BDZ71682.1 hypothetical protein GCM10025861_21990 [Methanobacterium petrolearium]
MSTSVSVIIVNHNHRHHIEECLKTIYNDKSLEIIVVDNVSTDSTPGFIEEHFRMSN